MSRSSKAQISATNKSQEHTEYYECIDRRKEISGTSHEEKESIKIVEIDTARPFSTCTAQNSHTSQVENFQDYKRRPSSYTASSPLHRMQNLCIQPPFPSSPGRLKPVEMQSASPRSQGKEKHSSAAHQTTSSKPKSNYFDTSTVGPMNSLPKLQPTYMAATVSAHARARSLSTPRQRSSTPQNGKKRTTKKRLSFTAPEAGNELELSRLCCYHSFQDPCCIYINRNF